MHPFFHPTTLLVLDDDPDYVESFKFHFGDQFPCVSYTQPERAIEHILSQEAQRPTLDSIAAQPGAGLRAHRGQTEPVIGGAEQILRMLGDSSRFRRVSVLVVDYDMPSMTGVQVCRALHHLPVRKLLLTGKAGVETAISAFNEGVIDTFLTKHDPEIEKTLPRQILRLQDEYFKTTTDGLAAALRREDIPFMTDPRVIESIDSLIKDRNVVEHYLMANPTGALLIDQSGAALMLVVLDRETLRSQWEVARDNGAPNELLDVLASQRVIPLFPTSSGYFEKDVGSTWPRYLYPAQRIESDRVWYTTLVLAGQVPHIFPPRLTTFATFEEQQLGRQQSN